MGIIDLNESQPGRTLVKEIIAGDYRFHQMTDNSYLVFKEIDEEPSYEINAELGCNCPSATYRAKSCKHEKLIGFGRGEEGESDTEVESAKGSGEDDSDDLLSLLE